MSTIFNVTFLIIFNINIIFCYSAVNNSGIITIKFKTYFPYIENKESDLNGEDYYKKIHLSKLYLELNTGNETSFEKGKNQTLNTIINLKEITFVTTNIYFKEYTEINNNLLCFYNTSKSLTFKESKGYYKYDDFDTLVSYSHEYFKIFTDLSSAKYNITYLNLYNTINHNISTICGNIGLVYFHTESHSYNFMGQLHKIFNLNDFTFLFNYTNNNEGIFIFGNKPHVYLDYKYKEEDLISFYSTYIYDFSVNSDTININDNITKEIVKIKINPDIEGIECPKYYFNIIENIFFNEYYNKKICNKESLRIYDIVICNQDFNENMIKAFPKIEFKIENFLIKFNGDDLFYKNNNKYYFKILERATEKYFEIGRILFKKYITMFNPKDRLIFFYNIEEAQKQNDEKNHIALKYIIIIIVLSIFMVILFPVGFYLGKQIYQKRKKRAYELNDNFDYTSSKEGEEPLFN